MRIFEWLVCQYADSARSYHNLEHLYVVVSLLLSLEPAVTPAALIAGWFHDAIHDPVSAENEERSAEQVEIKLRPLGWSLETLAAARDLVIHTRHISEAMNREQQCIHDAVLGVFGFHREACARYASNIGQEYAEVPDEVFRSSRARLLRKFLKKTERGRFFHVLDQSFERQVRPNLEWEIGLLEK